MPGGHYFAQGSNRFADILPAHAGRAAALDRRGAAKLAALSGKVEDGTLDMELPLVLERHRAARSALGGWNGVIGGARMIADRKLYEAALDASARQCSTGARWPSKPLNGGVPALGGNMILRWSTPLSTAKLNVRGYVPPRGPVLDDAPWGELLVVEARPTGDDGLRLRLEPFEYPVERAVLKFRQLVAGRSYTVTVDGAAVDMVADQKGWATHTMNVSGPTTVEVVGA